ncbi:MAG: phenylalanine--tRNA ligase alpha subunit [Candidatus Parcubacteria bacterium]|nr:MAG: phenylalanine--tRNA ligase alpha subunit [Candidatus Parcubacteria bacterium]
MNLELELNNLFREIEDKFKEVDSLANLESLKIKYLGRKSYLANFPEILKKLDLEEKRKIGKLYNELKTKIEKLYQEKKDLLAKDEFKFDFDHPGKQIKIGKEHLVSQVMNEIIKIFIQLGFSTVDYNQIVSENENFNYLNIPPYHPARDIWDTIWVKEGNDQSKYLFRTHTSSFQIPVIKKLNVPLRAIILGKVFRYEATDKTHDFEFNQLDGISISQNTNLSHLRYVVEKFFENFFSLNKKILIRFRPGYFPFVEPGLEIDIGCIFCQGKGKKCSICKNTGFIEVAGAGMIHPNVLAAAKIDHKKYQGYAFGFGIDRLIMLRHSINDIRLLHSSDLRFIDQF